MLHRNKSPLTGLRDDLRVCVKGANNVERTRYQVRPTEGRSPLQRQIRSARLTPMAAGPPARPPGRVRHQRVRAAQAWSGRVRIDRGAGVRPRAAGRGHVGAAREGHDPVQPAAHGAGAQAQPRRRPQSRRWACPMHELFGWPRGGRRGVDPVAADLSGIPRLTTPSLAQTPRDEIALEGGASCTTSSARSAPASRCCSSRR